MVRASIIIFLKRRRYHFYLCASRRNRAECVMWDWSTRTCYVLGFCPCALRFNWTVFICLLMLICISAVLISEMGVVFSKEHLLKQSAGGWDERGWSQTDSVFIAEQLEKWAAVVRAWNWSCLCTCTHTVIQEGFRFVIPQSHHTFLPAISKLGTGETEATTLEVLS